MTTTAAQHLDELRNMVAEVLEVEPEEISETGEIAAEHEADSLQAIEILARIEKTYDVEIPQEELAKMITLRAIYDVVASYAGWED
jgi:acyl carrier protein